MARDSGPPPGELATGLRPASRDSAKPASDAAPCQRECRTAFFMTGGVNGRTRSPTRRITGWGPCREGSRPGVCRYATPPAFGGLCRPEVGVPAPARRVSGWGQCREGSHPGVCRYATPSAYGGLCRPEVGVPWPTRHPALRGTRREGSHPDGWGLRRRGPVGRGGGVKTGVPWVLTALRGRGRRRGRGRPPRTWRRCRC